MEVISLLSLGAVAGLLSGLLGIGGGGIIVPVLVWIFQGHTDIPANYLMHIAIATSLATIIVTSLSSLSAHHRQNAVRWDIVRHLLFGIALGSVLGAYLVDALASDTLKTIFALFLLTAAVQLLSGKQPPPHRQLPNRWGMGFMGIIIGKISVLVGIGGGSITVPFLVGCRVPIRQAVATSAACGLPIAITGSVGLMIAGWSLDNLPAWTSGYIYWPAFLAIAPTSLVFAPLGAKLAHTISVTLLKKIFALLLLFLAIKMLF